MMMAPTMAERQEAKKIQLVMQLRRNGITDTAVLGAIERVPREYFVPEALVDRAYDDVALPIGHGQTISQPLIVAKMTQELAAEPRHKVLEIGTGSGYQTAILARLCRRVYSMERHRPLLALAEKRFDGLKINNVTAIAGDGTKGWPAQAPFDRIMVTAAGGDEPPIDLLHQLSEGGIMLIPLGANPRDQHLYRIIRRADGYEQTRLWPVRFVPLIAEGTGNESDEERPA